MKRALQAILLAAACALPIGIFILLQKFAVNVPQWDEWAVAILVVKLHQHVLALHDLWEQHNEHRMLVPYAIMMLLAEAGGWNVIKEIFFSLVLVVLSQIVLFQLLARTFRGTVLAVAFLFASLCLYATSQAENWMWGFQIAWFLTELLLLIEIWLLTAYPLAAASFWLAVAVSFLASYTMSAGLTLWIVGFVVLWLYRKDVGPAKIAAWVMAAIIAIGVYLHGWSRTGLQSNPSYVFLHPVEFFGYLFTYFGGGLGSWYGPKLAMALGAIIFGTYVFLNLAYVRKPTKNLGDPEIAWIALGTFAILAASMTDVGRLAFGIEQAMAGRYATYADLMWIATGALALGYWLPAFARPRFRVAAAVAAAAFLFIYVRATLAGVEGMRAVHYQDEASLQAVKTYATADDSTLLTTFPDPAALRTFARDLQSVHDGPFHP